MKATVSQRLRVFGIVALALFWSAISLPNLIERSLPVLGCLGYETGFNGTVTSASCAAKRAGIVPGDRIRLDKLRLDQRYNGERWPWANSKVSISVLHHGNEREVQLVADPISTPASEALLLAIRKAAQLLFIIIAGWILLRSPSRMTWGFYLYALGNAMINVYMYSFLPAIPFYVLQFLSYMLSWVGQVGLVIFALRFPDNRSTGWRERSEKTVPSIIVAGAAFIAIVYALDMLGIMNGPLIVWLQFAPSVPLYIWACYAMGRSFVEANEMERVRLRWAIVGTVTGTLLSVMSYANYPLQYMSQPVLLIFGTVATVIIPISIGYAIVRHRVIDVRFVLNRTIVFSVIVASAAAIFIAFDWLFADVLRISRLQVAIALAASFGFGLVVSRAYNRLVVIVDSVLFPKRRAAMVRLNDIRLVVERENEPQEIQALLTERTCTVLQLASGAIFTAAADGGFIREQATGWSTDALWHLLRDDPVVQKAHSLKRTTRVDDMDWQGLKIPASAAGPVLLIPMISRRRIVAMTLYGAHINGTDIDPDEASALADLCTAASPAFDAMTALHLSRVPVTS